MDCLLFLLFTSTFSRVLKKRKKRLCYRLSQIEFESAISNLEQSPSNLVFLKSKSTCEENVFPKGGEGTGTIKNVKES